MPPPLHPQASSSSRLLSEEERPTLLVDAEGRVRCAGEAALSLLDSKVSARRLLQRLREGPREGEDDELAWTVLEGGYLCSVGQTPGEDEDATTPPVGG